jgi:hypothetical protein
MSAETLRRAASLMRERAGNASDGPWRSFVEGRDHLGGDSVICGPGADIYVRLDAANRTTTTAWTGTQDHIASWHPAVALAVADWLDEVAERQKPTTRWSRRSHGWTGAHFANAVALAYLGESA